MSTSVYRMAQNKCVEKKVRVERKEGIIIKTFHLWSIHFFNQLTINFNNFWKMLLPPSFNAIWWFQSSTTEVNKIHNWNLKQTTACQYLGAQEINSIRNRLKGEIWPLWEVSFLNIINITWITLIILNCIHHLCTNSYFLFTSRGGKKSMWEVW